MRQTILEFYRDDEGKYRWRIKAKNGTVMANSANGYSRYQDCTEALHKLLKSIGSGWRHFHIKFID